jgi:hypothetical protein
MSSGYENAPATIMLATHCAVCARPLVDAKSVDAGIGPECRKRHGYNEVHDEESRAAANRIVHAVALARANGRTLEGDWDALVASTALAGLGFRKLAQVLAERAATVRIEEVEGTLFVFAPFSEPANEDWRRIGARWDKERKCRFLPSSRRKVLWEVLQKHFSGACAVGPRGPFRVEAAARPVSHVA